MNQAVPEVHVVNDFDELLQHSTYEDTARVGLQVGVMENATRAQLLVVVRNLALHQDELALDGHRNAVDWMCFNFGLPFALASSISAVADRLHICPLLFEHFAKGQISWDRFALISDGIDDEHSDAWWRDNERFMSTAECKAEINKKNAPVDTREAFEKRRVTARRRGAELLLTAAYPLDMGLQMFSKIDGEAKNADLEEETGGYPMTWTARADALAAILSCSEFKSEADRPTVVIYAPLSALDPARYGEHGINAQLEDVILSSETFQRILCDARFQVARQDGHGHTVGIGDQSRNLPRSLRRLIAKRDKGCRFPGCQKTRWVDIHHIKWWSKGGPTNLDNLITLCVAHHHYVHELGWTIEGNPEDGPVKFVRPNGEELRPPVTRMNSALFLESLDLIYKDESELFRAAWGLGPP